MVSRAARLPVCTAHSIITWQRYVVYGRVTMEPRDSFIAANQRTRKLQAAHPKAVSTHYDGKTRRIVIRLNSGLEVSFSPRDAEGLEHATAAKLEPIEISPSGFGLYFPKLDVDIYLPALLEGFLGSRKWMASRLGAAGGTSTSTAKTSAAKANGRLGGRPRKKMTTLAAK
jgi:Protein of unknown function (DUF2442)